MGLDTGPVVQQFQDAYQQGRADAMEGAERDTKRVGILVARLVADSLAAASVIVREDAPEAAEFFTQKQQEFESAVQEWQAPPAPEEATATEAEAEPEPEPKSKRSTKKKES
jgi:hypothetical protein